MNKINRGRYESYMKSNTRFLHEVYASHSREKDEAFNDCMATMHAYNGSRPRIISANRWRFTFGFLYRDEETNDPMMMYIGTHRPEYWGAPVDQMLVPINLKDEIDAHEFEQFCGKA